MNIIVAKSAGFCHGVRRAVDICEKASGSDPGCVTLGPIIHNKHVILKLENRGVRAVSNILDIPQGSAVIIRSHGVGKTVYEKLAASGHKIIDATCPDVKRIHEIVAAESKEGRFVLIIGERSHPEVTAISAYADEHMVFETETELSEWLAIYDNANKPVSIVFQTTSVAAVYDSCVGLLKKVCTNQRIFDTICRATFKRQQEAEEISKSVDVMIVVGDRNSSNSLKLADICKEHCSRVWFVEGPDELDNVDIRPSDTVGVTAGASTPAWIIKEVSQKMSDEMKVDSTNPEPAAAEAETETPEVAIEKEDPASPVIPDAEHAQMECKTGTEETELSADVDEAAEPDLPAAVPVESDKSTELPEATVAVEIIDDKTIVEEPVRQEPVIDSQTDQASGFYDDSMDDTAQGAESFAEMLEKSIKTLSTGEKITGIVTSITASEVSVDLGAKQSGYIPISEFIDDANVSIEDVIKIGDTIEAFVMRVNDVEGMIMLSKKRLDAIKNWDVIEAARETRAIVEGYVTEENKGGIVVNVKGVRVFVPASQTGLPKNAPMSDLLKKTIKLRITEVNQSRRRVVGSVRAVQSDERREKADSVWTGIEAGKQYDGVVKSMTSYGVFVDIGGVDGMIHISELSWTRVKQPSEVMSVGDEVKVYVLSFDKENRKISLGYKKLEDNPWARFKKGHTVGDVVTVKIVKMMPFGAFAEIVPGVDGLIHISQITDHRIGLPSEVLSNGQVVDVKITEIDDDRKKVSLSIRALIDPSSQPVTEAQSAETEADNTPVIVYDTDSPPESIADNITITEPETPADKKTASDNET